MIWSFCRHKHSWIFSHGPLKNIKWWYSYRCWNAWYPIKIPPPSPPIMGTNVNTSVVLQKCWLPIFYLGNEEGFKTELKNCGATFNMCQDVLITNEVSCPYCTSWTINTSQRDTIILLNEDGSRILQHSGGNETTKILRHAFLNLYVHIHNICSSK